MGKKETRGLVVLTLGFCTVFSGAYFWRCVRELTDPSAIELAQIARNVSDGEGFTTDAVYPLSLGLIGRVKHHPELTTPPLPTLLTACAFVLRRPSDRVAQAASGILLIPTLVLIWMVGRRVSGPGVAAVACLGYVLSGAVLLNAFSGGPTQLVSLLFTLWLYRGVCRRESRSKKGELAPWTAKQLLWSGVLFGLLALSDWHFGWLWVVAAVLVVRWSKDQPARRVVPLFLVGMVAVCLPWLARNHRVTGNALFSIRTYYAAADTPEFPGTSLLRTLALPSTNPVELAAGNLGEVVRKLGRNLLRFGDVLSGWLSPYLFVVFLPPLLLRGSSPTADRLRSALLAFILLRALAGFVGMPTSGFLLPFAPIGMVLAADFLLNSLAARIPDERKLASQLCLSTVLLVLAGVPTCATIALGAAPRNSEVGLASLRTQFPPDAVLISDAPWSVAWYGERKALWAPTGVKDMALIETQVTPIAGLVLTRGALSLSSKEDDESINWTRLHRNPGFWGGYRARQRLSDGTVVFERVERDSVGSLGPQ
jgi:hypothetical protein